MQTCLLVYSLTVALQECLDARLWTAIQNIRAANGPLRVEESELRHRLDVMNKERLQAVDSLKAAQRR